LDFGLWTLDSASLGRRWDAFATPRFYL